MLAPSPESVLAILAEFWPSLLVVAPFLPVLLLVVALLGISARAVELPPIPAVAPRRQFARQVRPEALAASLVLALAITALALGRGVSA